MAQWRIPRGGKGPLPSKLMTNSVKYVPPHGYLWHLDITKFNHEIQLNLIQYPSPFPTPRRLQRLALGAFGVEVRSNGQTDTGGGPLNPISGSAPAIAYIIILLWFSVIYSISEQI